VPLDKTNLNIQWRQVIRDFLILEEIGSNEIWIKPKKLEFKGIVHFEITFWYVLAYFKGIQDVVFVSAVVSILKTI